MLGWYKVDFEELEWESPCEGIRHKCIDRDGVRMRLVEYSRTMQPHWCEKGHYGYLIDGHLEIEYVDSPSTLYKPGDGIFIPDGPEHRHLGRVLSDRVLVFFVERIQVSA